MPSDEQADRQQARGSVERSASSGQLPAISLPKGGGAIRGVGEKFAANPVTGSASMTIPLATSPGRAGFGPQLSLTYDSGNGNGPFGFGWSLSLARISRKTDKGLPQYRDAEESDVFLLSGAEDLVPVVLPDGARYEDASSHPGFTIHRYRPRAEGLFARIERWTSDASGDVHWRSITRENVTTIYGRGNESRIFDPSEAARARRVFEWLICESYDDKGNAIVFEYAAENDVHVNRMSASERNRVRSANRYPKRIKYGNLVSRLAQADLSDAYWLFEVVFDYDEGHYAELPLDATRPGAEQHRFARACIDSNGGWRTRPDPFSVYRPGFEVRSYRRCRRVLMFHRFAELGPDPCLVRATELEYDDMVDYDREALPSLDAELAHQGSTRYASFIRRVVQSGYVRDNVRPSELQNGLRYVTYLKKSLPPLELEYSKAKIQDEIRVLDDQSRENLPVGVNGHTYQWVDLDGEGLSGILVREGGAWHYKPSLGDGAFGALRSLRTQPSLFARAAGGEQLLDLSGNGQLDAVAFASPTPGFYERTSDADWGPFRTFRQLPSFDVDDPNTRFVDLSGDGHADVLITEHEVLAWYPSLREEGFDSVRRVRKPWDEEQGPRLVFADGTQSIYLADMSGDGLTDLVRIRNGETCYWPNLGYGHFGPKVSMDNAPWFDPPDQFSQSRLRLADIDGSGTHDILYLGRDGVRVYFNQSGNAWSEARKLVGPTFDELSTVTTADVLGNGTACLVWSSPLPADSQSPLRYVDLMGGTKPHLLTRCVNNLGAETHIAYAPSTKFYLEDRRNGRPWLTRVPFPVYVVERVETYDRIGRNRFVTRYAYHHGYFDGHEREFRGFGLVEQYDTEEFAALSASNDFPMGSNVEAASHVPPVLTKTWFHTGVYVDRDHVSNYFAGSLDEYFREPGLTDAELRDLLLEDTTLPTGLTVDEEREACRALRGSLLRQEVYALDDTAKRALPYTVIERNYGVRCLQKRAGNRHSVFLKHPREEVVYNYERSLVPVLEGELVDEAAATENPRVEWRLDPRLAHSLTLEVDDFGNVLKAASIGYGRRLVDAALPAAARDEQAKTLVAYTENRVTSSVDGVAAYRAPLAYDARTYELTGYTPSGAAGRFRAEDLVTRTLAERTSHQLIFDEELAYEARPTAGRQRRLIEHVRTVFRRDDLVDALPLGRVESMALPFESYKLAFTPGLVDQVFNERGTVNRVSDAMLDGVTAVPGGRYVHTQDEAGAQDAGWWIPSGRTFFAAGPDDAAPRELEQARAHFFLPRRVRNPFHTVAASTECFIAYDDYDLLIAETQDALGNRVTAGERHQDPTEPLVANGQDYRVLQPALVMDPNRNRTALAFDALGMVVGTAVMGKPEDEPASGDSLTAGFRSDLTQAELEAFLSAPKGPVATQLLADATSRIIVDVTAYAREPDLARKRPTVAVTLQRETHVAEPLPRGGRIQVAFAYSDGFGREVQKKVQAEAGSVPVRDASGGIVLDANEQPLITVGSVSPRWVGTGWTVFNNKGKPVRQYEPYFSDRHDFEFDVRIGKSPVLFYDPALRVVATLHPNHTWEKVVLGPWRQVSWDVGDTVLSAPAEDADVGGLFARLPASEQDPTWHALRTNVAHEAALAARYPDAVLRSNELVAARQSEIYARTPTVAHADPLGRPIVTVAHNRAKYGNSDEAPPELYATRVVLDIEGNQREVLDARGCVVVRYEYDMLGSRIHQASMEAGRRWTLSDVAGKPLYAWDDRGHRFRSAHDVLQRPTDSFLLEGVGPEVLLGRCVYGESRAHPEASNLRGKVVALFDQAGVVTSEHYDFKGNLLSSARQLADTVHVDGRLQAAYKSRIDWSETVTLATERFVSRARFDALNRTTQVVAPHSDQPGASINVIQPRYDDAKLLRELDVWLGHGEVPAALIDSAVTEPSTVGVTNIAYDAKAQRQSVDYKNGVSTRYTYDAETFRLVQLRTEAASSAQLQHLSYTCDVAGNITHIRDAAQQTVFFANARVEPSAHYTYDALSRLIEATGREHLGQVGGAPIAHSYDDAPRTGRAGIPHPNDGQALGTYVERYFYDQVGNIVAMRHAGTDPARSGWTRTYAYNEPSQLESRETSNRLTSTSVGNGTPLVESYSSSGDGYDAHGNLQRMPQLQIMRWNEHDQLQMTQRQAINQGDAGGVEKQGERTWYVYDSGGQRIRKVTELANGQVKDERDYLGGFEIYRRPADGLVRETLHVMDDKQRIAIVETRTRGSEPGIPRELVRYQLGNHLGSAALEVDGSAQVLSYEEYTPYGSSAYQAVRSQLQTPKRYRYTGMERDEESGLGYHSARYYAPWLGRWTSADPSGLADGLNVYAYVRNNPLRGTDRGGRQTEPRPVVPSNPNLTPYTVQEGDTLSSVAAERPGVTTGDLLEVNAGVDPRRLQVGQQILVPTQTQHVIRRGETLAGLAAQSGGEVSTEELLALNPEVDPRRLQVGQEINITPELEIQVQRTYALEAMSAARRRIGAALRGQGTEEQRDAVRQVLRDSFPGLNGSDDELRTVSIQIGLAIERLQTTEIVTVRSPRGLSEVTRGTVAEASQRGFPDAEIVLGLAESGETPSAVSPWGTQIILFNEWFSDPRFRTTQLIHEPFHLNQDPGPGALGHGPFIAHGPPALDSAPLYQRFVSELAGVPYNQTRMADWLEDSRVH